MSDQQTSGQGGESEPRGGGNTSLLPVTGTAKEENKRPWVKPLIFGIVAIALLVGIIWGVNTWSFSRTHVSTDDAYVTGNLVSVSPIISGTLQTLLVDEGTYVHRGQLIARIDPAGPEASLRQAQANYNAAASQIPQAERNLRYQQQATDAAIRKARASLAMQQARATGAQQQVTLAAGTTHNQVRQARSQVDAAAAQLQQALALAQAARVSVDNYRQAVQTALAAQDNYQQQVQTAQKAADAAQARVQAELAEVNRTRKDETRYAVLYQQDAVSAQVYDSAHAQARTAQATLQADQSAFEQAQSQVEQARVSVRQAQSQVEQARQSVVQAQAQARAAQRAAGAAREQVAVARAGVGLAQANGTQVGIQQANLLSTTLETGSYEADVANARAGQEQVGVRREQIATARAQAQQALAALTNARIVLNDTIIVAPNDGTVVKKDVNIGASLAPGQSIVTMTQGDYTWVEANFKETQLTDVRPGQSAEIDVDAFPGKVFKGRVQSINRATGAATSLLPPDNATGNFTKVVQRVPVRIEFIPAGDNENAKYARVKDIQNLRQGMSVNATIDIASGPKNAQGGSAQQANGAGQSEGATGGVTGAAPNTGSTGGGTIGGASIDGSSPANGGAAGGNQGAMQPSAGATMGGTTNPGAGPMGAGSDAGSTPNGSTTGPAMPNNPVPNPGTGPLSGGQNGGQTTQPGAGPGGVNNNGMGAPAPGITGPTGSNAPGSTGAPNPAGGPSGGPAMNGNPNGSGATGNGTSGAGSGVGNAPGGTSGGAGTPGGSPTGTGSPGAAPGTGAPGGGTGTTGAAGTGGAGR